MNTQKHHPNAEKHPFEPVFNEKSRVLILGSFPSKISKEAGFYYGNGKGNNRFWGILNRLFDEPDLKKKSKQEKIAFLLDKKIALWDIWAICYKKDLESIDDDSIIADNDENEPDKSKRSQKVDLTKLLETAQIKKIYTIIGDNSFEKWGIEKWLWSYAKYFPHCKISTDLIISLCSTSGATRRSYVDLIEKDGYKQIAEF